MGDATALKEVLNNSQVLAKHFAAKELSEGPSAGESKVDHCKSYANT
jgi:hypothetical protein